MNTTALQNILTAYAGHPLALTIHLTAHETAIHVVARPGDDVDTLVAVVRELIPEATVTSEVA